VYARQIYKQQQASIGYNASSERRYVSYPVSSKHVLVLPGGKFRIAMDF
jgi:hypothetical protein